MATLPARRGVMTGEHSVRRGGLQSLTVTSSLVLMFLYPSKIFQICHIVSAEHARCTQWVHDTRSRQTARQRSTGPRKPV